MNVATTITFTGVLTLGDFRQIHDATEHLAEDMAIHVESTPYGPQIVVADPPDADGTGTLRLQGPVGAWHPNATPTDGVHDINRIDCADRTNA